MRFLADENFNRAVFTGLLRRIPSLDIVRVQDVGLIGAEDPVILEWAVQQNRILISHDVSTMTRFAYERIRNSSYFPGLFAVKQTAAVGQVIEDLVLLVECSTEDEWRNRICFIPI